MANTPGSNGESKSRRRQRSHNNELNDRRTSKSGGGADVIPESDVSDLRDPRLDRTVDGLEQNAGATTMASESHTSLPSKTRRKKDPHRSTEEKKHRRRRKSNLKEDANINAHGDGTRSNPNVERRSGSDADASESDEDRVKVVKPKARKVRVVYVTEEQAANRRRKEKKDKAVEEVIEVEEVPRRSESIRRNKAHQSRRKSVVETSLPRRSASTKDISSTSRPTLKRSNTTSSQVPQSKVSVSTTAKRSSFLGSFFGPTVVPPTEPERLVECLTCMDDVPRSKSAKLKCSHRMCHSCLRRVFKLSVTDPQHMPPKCCTSDHIPLKHVDKLFDINFKKTWNKKFQEFSTKNRIYCPGKRCGEWIKPSHIYKKDGKKYGECTRCRMKVCCLCNGKWHGTKDCPKDEETNKLLDAAKEAGWQRCYSCRTMVELKEGCNHMTCRCTAQFCMICGLKWKTCNCPWFNYDAVEEDRLNHMRIPEVVEVVEVDDRPNRLRRQRGPPNNYQAELDARRRQERADEELARRLQRNRWSSDEEDYQGGIGNMHGIGNGAGHFMNQDYVRAAQNILTGRFDQATAAANYVMGVAQARGPGGPPQPPAPPRMNGRFPVPRPPPLRRQSTRDVPPNIDRPTGPGRIRSESDVRPRGPSPPPPPGVRPAVLAGLTGRGGNRVNAWRNHVEAGAPEEGVLSV